MTSAQRQKFLREVRFSANLAFAAKAAGCTQKEAFNERRLSTDFDREWTRASAFARDQFAKRLRESAGVL